MIARFGTTPHNLRMETDVLVSTGEPDLSGLPVRPGDTVVLKPNLVKEHKETDPSEWQSVITNPALIETVCRRVCEMLDGRGRVVICDAPQTDSSFRRIVEVTGLDDIARRCSKDTGIDVALVDLRDEEFTNEKGIIVERRRLEGDPEGSIAFRMGRSSHFYGFRGEGSYYGSDYDSEEVRSHHSGETQEYLICGTPVKADVYINMPKAKTHKKTGVTLNLKNLVGINADKNWLPHHTEGTPREGGDEFPDLTLKRRIERTGVKVMRQMALNVPWLGPRLAQRARAIGERAFGKGDTVIRSGNWYGNDTCWRMVLDLNRCLFFGAPDGSLDAARRKRYYSVVDGGVCMEGSGPMQGDPVEVGFVACGANPVAVDMVVARLMGVDWRKVPVIREALADHPLPLAGFAAEDVRVRSADPSLDGPFTDTSPQPLHRFRPHFGWKGHVEWEG